VSSLLLALAAAEDPAEDPAQQTNNSAHQRADRSTNQ
jgi:hypothetical protein